MATRLRTPAGAPHARVFLRLWELVITFASAAACSLLPCGPADLLPRSDDSVPANIAALVLMPDRHWPQRSRTSVLTAHDIPPPAPESSWLGAPLLVTDVTRPGEPRVVFNTTIVVNTTARPPVATITIPAGTLASDSTYAIDAPSLCAVTYGDKTRPLLTLRTTGALAPLPLRLGEVTWTAVDTDLIVVPDAGGGCSVSIPAAVATVHLALAPEAEVWRSALWYEFLVDGRVWEYRSAAPILPAPFGLLSDVVYAACAPYKEGNHRQGLAPGSHTLQARAWLPGTATEVSTAPVRFKLECPRAYTPDLTSPGRDLRSQAWGNHPLVYLPLTVSVVAAAVALLILLFARKRKESDLWCQWDWRGCLDRLASVCGLHCRCICRGRRCQIGQPEHSHDAGQDA